MNEKFEIRGVNHIAMVCADMSRTVRLSRRIGDATGEDPRHSWRRPAFFFDIGNDDCLAFSGFPERPNHNQESRVLAECPDGAILLQPMVR